MSLAIAHCRVRHVVAALVCATLALSVQPALAATDGAFGLLSVGTTDLSIIVGDTAMASGLDDIVLAPWSDGIPAPVGTTQACVFSSTGGYQVTATSSNAAGRRFRLSSGVNYLRYRVRWNDGASGLTPMTNGTPLTGQVGDSTDTMCGGAKPVTIEIRIPNGAITAASIGAYVDTLTVMITPQ